MRIIPDGGIQDFLPSDTWIVAGPYGVPNAPSKELGNWLRRQATQSRCYGSTCTGAFLLAHAGLLSGRVVTTHWQYAERLAALFPDLRVEPDRIFVQGGQQSVVSALIKQSQKLPGELYPSLTWDRGKELADHQ